jgi:hypothetical protein
LACSTSNRETTKQSKTCQQSLPLSMTSAKDGFIKQMTIFKEFGEFSEDIRELSKECSIEMARGTEM